MELHRSQAGQEGQERHTSRGYDMIFRTQSVHASTLYGVQVVEFGTCRKGRKDDDDDKTLAYFKDRR